MRIPKEGLRAEPGSRWEGLEHRACMLAPQLLPKQTGRISSSDPCKEAGEIQECKGDAEAPTGLGPNVSLDPRVPDRKGESSRDRRARLLMGRRWSTGGAPGSCRIDLFGGKKGGGL